MPDREFGHGTKMAGDFRDRAQHIHRLALLDAETGLPNRLGVEQHLIDELARRNGTLVVCALSMQDGALGFDAGEHFHGVILGRLGATSLALAFAVADAGAAQTTLAAMLERQGKPFRAGLVIASGGACDAYDLLATAEYALEKARAEGKQILSVDVNALRDTAGDAALLADLGASLIAGEICLYYQPKLRLSDGDLAGVECLARWTHPRRGVVSPDVFVPIAEAGGQIGPFTEWALDRALADQGALGAGGFFIPFSVNVSAALLSDGGFAARAIEKVIVAGGKLCFEITETAALVDPERALKNVASFYVAGIDISIDDYGARLSSLSYLMDIPAQELKIDKRFVAMLETSAYDRALVSSMIDLAHDLGLKVTAEGVESAAALDILKQMQCDIVQGNFIAPPLDFAHLQKYLARF